MYLVVVRYRHQLNHVRCGQPIKSNCNYSGCKYLCRNNSANVPALCRSNRKRRELILPKNISVQYTPLREFYLQIFHSFAVGTANEICFQATANRR